MCFSAQASFTSAAFLSISALLSTSLARKKWEYAFACTPLFFALQQFFEGLTWTGVATADPTLAGRLVHAGTYGFLFFALIFWPLWIPLVIYQLEPIKTNRALLRLPLIAGGAVAGLFISSLLQGPVQTASESQHIVYQLAGYPDSWSLIVLSSILYLIATVLPPFISSLPSIWIFGVATGASYLATYYFYTQALISVWCFFAAIISALIPWILYLWNSKNVQTR